MLPYSTVRVKREVGSGALEVCAVGEDALEAKHMMACGAIDERVRTAGVITHHTTYAAAVRGGRLGREEQSVRLEREIEFIAHDTRFDTYPTLFGIDLENMVHVAADVHHYTRPYDLSGDTGSGRTRNEVCVPSARFGKEFSNIVCITRISDTKRHLAVDRGIGCIRYAMQRVS